MGIDDTIATNESKIIGILDYLRAILESIGSHLEIFLDKVLIVSFGDCGHIKDAAVCFTRYEWELCKLDRYQVTSDYFCSGSPYESSTGH